MEFFTGLDVGMDETAICVVDDKGKVALQVTVVTDPEAIKGALKPYCGRLRRVGHEAGALSPWLHGELLRLGLPAICLETQHVRAAMSAQRNKTDKADALGLAHLMRTGWFRKAHIKSESCYRLRLLLTATSSASFWISRTRSGIRSKASASASRARDAADLHRRCAKRWPVTRWSPS